jgi:DNA polymerase III epsilon subunit family exonuclease
MLKYIEEVEFTIFDAETTGLNFASGDRIVELAGLRVKGKERIAKFDMLVNPHREISPDAFAVNKITPQMIEDAPGIEVVMPDFLDFIQGSYLCSYNAEFDLGFLNNELKIVGLAQLPSQPTFDILTMAKRLMPGQQRYALWFIAEKLGIKHKQQHRAFSDVEMAWDVFDRLKAICQVKGISDFAVFSSLFSMHQYSLDSDIAFRISQIEKAINTRTHLKIRYLSTKDAEISSREVVPKEIRQDARNKYLIGYCCLKKEECVFKIGNILEVEIV